MRLGLYLAHDLAPSARRDAEVYDPFDALQQTELLVQLDQFVSGTAAITFGLGLFYVRIVELPLQPPGRTRGAFFCSSHARFAVFS